MSSRNRTSNSHLFAIGALLIFTCLQAYASLNDEIETSDYEEPRYEYYLHESKVTSGLPREHLSPSEYGEFQTSLLTYSQINGLRVSIEGIVFEIVRGTNQGHGEFHLKSVFNEEAGLKPIPEKGFLRISSNPGETEDVQYIDLSSIQRTGNSGKVEVKTFKSGEDSRIILAPLPTH